MLFVVMQAIRWIFPEHAEVSAREAARSEAERLLKPSVVPRVIVVVLALLAGSGFLEYLSRAEIVVPRQPLAELPMVLDEWTGRRSPDFDKKILAVLGVDDYVSREYTQGTAAVALYVGYYATQRQGDTIHSPMNCLPGAGWQPLEQGRTAISAPGTGSSAPIEVNRVVIAKGLDRQLVLYWYQSQGRVVASEYWGKIYTVLDAVRYNRTDAALVRVVTPVGDGATAIHEAQERATAFVRALFPALERHVPS